MRSTSLLRTSLATSLVTSTLVVGAAITTTAPASAFGTVSINGQNQEHERITRILGKNTRGGPEVYFFEKTLDQLAGKSGTLGAVGAPDNLVDTSVIPVKGLGPGKKHCDDGDHFGDGYPRTIQEAKHAISECVEYYQHLMRKAVDYAGELVSANGTVNHRQAAIADCSYNYDFGGNDTAKCQVLNAFGRSLHLAEDFYSHSNWADRPDLSAPISITNPPGLGHDNTSRLFNFPAKDKTPDIPDRLITGCDDSVPISGSHHCKNRITHSVLAKDTGLIDAESGQAEPADKYVREKVEGNFQAAVKVARKQAVESWEDLMREIRRVYGQSRGNEIIRVITHDATWTDCNEIGGASAFAADAPRDRDGGARSTTIKLVNQSGHRLNCTRIDLDAGNWTAAPNSIGVGGSATWGSESVLVSKGNGTKGRVRFDLVGVRGGVSISWDNPSVGSNSYGCTAPAGWKCRRDGGSGNHASPTFTISPA